VKAYISIALIVLFALTPALRAADQTWTGQISDSACGAKHEEDADAAGGGKQGVPPERECTLACVKGGSKFVFVLDGKIYQIANQQDPALETHAGHVVKLTGEMKGDTITVSKIEMP
jgi:hypothetical protein